MLAALTGACLAAAAHAYQIPERDLYAILAVEGGRVGEAVVDGNGTRDLGPFQINTVWAPSIARYWKLSIPEALDRVRDDGCANAVIASAILKTCLIEAHGDYSNAIGLYHSHSAPLAIRYQDRVLRAAAELADGRVGR
jgi:hypothetical protein